MGQGTLLTVSQSARGGVDARAAVADVGAGAAEELVVVRSRRAGCRWRRSAQLVVALLAPDPVGCAESPRTSSLPEPAQTRSTPAAAGEAVVAAEQGDDVGAGGAGQGVGRGRADDRRREPAAVGHRRRCRSAGPSAGCRGRCR